MKGKIQKLTKIIFKNNLKLSLILLERTIKKITQLKISKKIRKCQE